MGGTQSSEGGRHGYHVLKVKENSPAYHIGIEPFFDYIVGINGIKLDNDPTTIQEQFLNNVDREVVLELYSSKEQELRALKSPFTYQIPRSFNCSIAQLACVREERGGRPDRYASSLARVLLDFESFIRKMSFPALIFRALLTHLLMSSTNSGASIRYCSYENAGEHVWHVLEVQPNSPAEMAGVVPHTDYVIGSPQLTMRSEDDFYNLVEEAVGRPLRLYIYNSEWDSTREVIIVPNNGWGGNGSLGCDVGYGLLHRIPRRRPTGGNPATRSVSAYSDTIFSSADYRYDGAFDDHLYHSYHHPHDHPHDHYHPHDHGDGHAHAHDGHEHEQNYSTYDDVHLHAQPPAVSPLPAPVPTPVISLGTLEQSVKIEPDTAAGEEEVKADPSSVGIEPPAPEPEVQAMVEEHEVDVEVEAPGEAGLAEEEEEVVTAGVEAEAEAEAKAEAPSAQAAQGGPAKSKRNKRKGK
ncbi:GRASP55/65 PDZ-like domain-containing protein [Endogone sp. FLAS-F59071]|nr:GRASP55/65 PDZ-like domain-containing protein [Endogone sp. FLAS-F59071]RUS18625.1 GRASP55/65 PDZ-like domain-containing protein [Endogone sp. FLAS-F59071]|eukprot:RUS16024.1 GRASP55/65 PDZ-like domain-containing protein [Endogone sp. FLAS-F59071]